MADKIKLDYRLADEMSKAFHKAHEQLEQTMQEMRGVADTVEGGALLGRGGDAFKDSIRGKLCTSIDKLARKMLELEVDVTKAKHAMQQADTESQQQFGN